MAKKTNKTPKKAAPMKDADKDKAKDMGKAIPKGKGKPY